MSTNQRLVARMAEHMRESRYEDATRDLIGLLEDGAKPVDLTREALTAASPFLNVPAHTMVTAKGEMRPVNYDHTMLAFWRSQRMGRMMPRGYNQLPLAQAMWYLPQGLDIWSQNPLRVPRPLLPRAGEVPRDQPQGPPLPLRRAPALHRGLLEDERLHSCSTASSAATA